MYKLCKTEQSTQRQRQLEHGLLRLMLVKRYEEISISDLCERMNIPRKSFDRYFSSKDGALFALLDHTMLDFYESGFHTADAETALDELELFFVFWYRQKELLDALQRSGLSGILVERATELAAKERLMPKRIKSWSTDRRDLALSFALCGLMSMILHWHRQGYPVSPEEMTAVAAAMLTRPLIEL